MYDEITGVCDTDEQTTDSYLPSTMSDHDRSTIERYARGEWDLKWAAYQAYERNKHICCSRCTKHLNFMREVVEPTDLGRRMVYRSQLIESVV